jgi:hypothetical protein
MVAPGMAWESISRAASSFPTTFLQTLKWTRRSSALSGTITSRLEANRLPPPSAIPDVGNREGGTTFGCAPVGGADASESSGSVAMASGTTG